MCWSKLASLEIAVVLGQLICCSWHSSIQFLASQPQIGIVREPKILVASNQEVSEAAVMLHRAQPLLTLSWSVFAGGSASHACPQLHTDVALLCCTAVCTSFRCLAYSRPGCRC